MKQSELFAHLLVHLRVFIARKSRRLKADSLAGFVHLRTDLSFLSTFTLLGKRIFSWTVVTVASDLWSFFTKKNCYLVPFKIGIDRSIDFELENPLVNCPFFFITYLSPVLSKMEDKWNNQRTNGCCFSTISTSNNQISGRKEFLLEIYIYIYIWNEKRSFHWREENNGTTANCYFFFFFF